MKYRLSDIENFIGVYGCKTISEAAKKLEISQPALSESIKRLEEDLGYQIFYRSRTGIQITPSGQVFLKKAQSLMDFIKDLDIDQDDKIFANRTLSIGCHTTVAQYTLPEAFNYLAKVAPDYKFNLIHGLSREIQGDIQKGKIDVGVVINPTQVPDLVLKKLAEDVMGVWSGKNNTHTDTLFCNLDMFQTQSILKKWKSPPHRIISTESLEVIIRLVSEGLGYGILPAKAAQLSHFAIKRQTDLPSYKDEIYLVYRPEFGKIPAEKVTLDAIMAAYRKK